VAAILAEMDPDVARPGEEIQHRPGGPIFTSAVFPMFEEKYLPIFSAEYTIRERAHLLLDALFDADERVEQGHFFRITLNL
jgi:hypothetical protein